MVYFCKMDILSLPSDYLERSSQIFISEIEARTKESVDFIKNKYTQKELFYKCTEFMQHSFCDMMKADFSHTKKVDNFPIIESFCEMQYAISHALIGSYKASFADLRRSLEMSLTIPFFTKENLEKYKDDDNLGLEEQLIKFDTINEAEIKKANDWVFGKSNTPFFGGEMLKELVKSGRYKEINEECSWKEKIEKLYYNISDYAHNKGYQRSYRELNDLSSFIGSIPFPKIKIETLKSFCDLYIQTVQQNLVILTLYNPLVLVGLPLEQKFGFNEPASGFFRPDQSELLWEILPNDYHGYFHRVRTTDNEVLDIENWIIDKPNVSEYEYVQQMEQFLKLVNKLS